MTYKFSHMKILLLILLFITLSGCTAKKNWTGFYYSNINKMEDESTWVIQPGFETLDDCKEWVDDIYDSNDNYDYECGYGCRYNKGLRVNVCEITEQ